MNTDKKRKEGLKKIRTIIDNTPVAMMATNLEKIPFSVYPMTTQEMDDQDDLWFFVQRDSNIFKDIEKDNRAQLIYSNEVRQEYLSVFGNAVHIVDSSKVNQLWNPTLKKWFSGKDDPNLALLNLNIEVAHFWDVPSNKPVSLLTGGLNLAEKGMVNLQDHQDLDLL